MTESSYVKNGNFREYFYCAGGEFCSLETGIPGGLPGPDPRRGWVKCCTFNINSYVGL